jgi:glycosyltransferase involved in cell wall biosynthesis
LLRIGVVGDRQRLATSGHLIRAISRESLLARGDFQTANVTVMQNVSRPPYVIHIINTPMMLGFFTGQVAFFRAHGFVWEVASSPGAGLMEFGMREGIAVHAVNMTRTITPLRDLVTLYHLWRLFRRSRPTVVDAHTPKGGLLGMTAAWLARVPVRVYHVHGLPVLTASWVRRVLLRWSDRVAGQVSHRVICVSHSIHQAALDERLFPAGKARVLARGTINGVDSAVRFNPAVVGREAGPGVRAALGIPAQARVLGFVGRVVCFKGVVELAGAWRGLRERYPDMHLLIVGPFESKDPIPAEIKEELAHDPRVHLVAGWVEDTRPYYAALDVLALPSHREGFPYALLEAASMQLPVVATTVPGCVDAVVDGVTGALVRPFDARALADAVAVYMDDPGLRQEHGRAGRERVAREFGQQAVWEALLAEYRELLDARPGAARRPVIRAESPESRR